jgi:hypothetical protein
MSIKTTGFYDVQLRVRNPFASTVNEREWHNVRATFEAETMGRAVDAAILWLNRGHETRAVKPYEVDSVLSVRRCRVVRSDT